MALTGIDTQIMVQRTTDYSKVAESDPRKGQLMQEYTAAMLKAGEDIKASTVTRREDPDKVRMSEEKGGRGQGEPGGEKGGEEPEPTAPRKEEKLETGIGRIIDITM